jgi:hypothetical protein
MKNLNKENGRILDTLEMQLREKKMVQLTEKQQQELIAKQYKDEADKYQRDELENRNKIKKIKSDYFKELNKQVQEK